MAFLVLPLIQTESYRGGAVAAIGKGSLRHAAALQTSVVCLGLSQRYSPSDTDCKAYILS